MASLRMLTLLRWSVYMGRGAVGEEEVAKRVAKRIPYSSPCNMVAEWPKLLKEPQKEAVGEADAKVMERKVRGETGDGNMEASEATREEIGEGQGRGSSVERESRSCSARC
jgi:hypothetical protein